MRYERELTVGSIGTLWLGRLVAGSEAGRTVLLRRMAIDLFTKKDVESLKQVAQAYSQVRHPSFAKLLGVIEQDRDLISVSEHLDGVRLNDLMRNCIDTDTPLPATAAVRIVLDAARATIKAHRLAGELGLFPVDRLFVPEGVFVAAFGGTLLTEVGVLAAIARCNHAQNIPDMLAQLAPEELDKSVVESGSPEVFSLGVMLWEALANRSLFSRDSARQTLNDVRNLAIDPLDSIERCGMPVPDSLAELVKIATQRHPSQRYASLEQFVSAIEQLPAHFIATEHHVAAALRSQAAELLKAIHVDPSQASLTIAFSEIPASRMSTRPPPENGHNWDPPTFDQSSLVAGPPRTLALPKPGCDAEPGLGSVARTNVGALPSASTGSIRESLQGAVPVCSTAPEPRQRRSWNKQLLWPGLLVMLLLAAAAAAFIHHARRHAYTAIQPETTNVSSDGILLSASANTTDFAAPAENSSATPPSAPITHTEPGKGALAAKSVDVPPPESNTTGSVPKRSGAAYRPRQIAPYRPKGI